MLLCFCSLIAVKYLDGELSLDAEINHCRGSGQRITVLISSRYTNPLRVSRGESGKPTRKTPRLLSANNAEMSRKREMAPLAHASSCVPRGRTCKTIPLSKY